MHSIVVYATVNALIPVALAAVYLFGWRVLALVGVSGLFACLAEWAMLYNAKNGKISQAAWVTGALYGLSLPPTAPYWVAAVGVASGARRSIWAAWAMSCRWTRRLC